jgi:hypothetical protein
MMTSETHVARATKAGALAAFANAAVALATLFVALALIGPAALTDRDRFVELALDNPIPLLLQDALKFAAAACALVLIRTLHTRLSADAPALMRAATLCGLISVALLLTNAALSLVAVSRAAPAHGPIGDGGGLNAAIGLIGLAVILTSGLWYLLLSRAALKGGGLPRGLARLGLLMGVLSLLPLLGLLVLLLSVPWSLWLGGVLHRDTAASL